MIKVFIKSLFFTTKKYFLIGFLLYEGYFSHSLSVCLRELIELTDTYPTTS